MKPAWYELSFKHDRHFSNNWPLVEFVKSLSVQTMSLAVVALLPLQEL